VRELEAWGAVFDRTKDGRILQRNFGGHRYPRLAHVGDRTGLEMIRTLQDHGIHQGIEVHMECTVLTLLWTGRIAGAFGYDRERGRFIHWSAKAVVLATGGIGRAFKITSNSWEYTGDGHALAYRAGAALMDMEFVQFHPTGMVWPPSVRGILVTEGVRGEGGVLRNKRRQALHVRRYSGELQSQTADNEEEGWRYTQGDKNARRPPELLTRDHVARCINREVKEGRGSPHGGVFLDIAWIKEKSPNAAEHIKRKLPSMYHQFKQLADIDITKGADGSRPHHALHDGRRARGWRYADVGRAGPVRAGEVRGGSARRQSAGRKFAVRSAGVRQARRRVRREVRQGATARGRSTNPQQVEIARARARAVRARSGGRESLSDAARAAGHDAGPGRHRARRSEMEEALEVIAS
jgi:succinate dehydrogenase/fumarate reductase flavoprotein subunit